MSHTIGQVKEDNQQSTSNSSTASQDLSTSVDKSLEPASLLSDANYEFLFNQLLEGIAHGWHDRRIEKFFNQLGDRGKAENWIAWLERLRVKLITLPVQSKRQLGTMMIRLGELTQSTLGVKEIGSVSNRIGRELLFGNTEDVIWEYVGTDIAANSSPIETKEDISDRLPTDFSELGSAAISDGETDLVTEEVPSKESSNDIANSHSEQPVHLEKKQQIKTDSNANKEEVVVDELMNDLFFEPTLLEDSFPSSDESTAALSPDNVVIEPESNSRQLENTATHGQEFEFELDNSTLDEEAELPQVNSASDNSKEFSNLSESDVSAGTLSEPDPDPIAMDMEQVMNLIQEDSSLAAEISQKLNVSPASSSQNNLTAGNQNLENDISTTTELDESSIELIEGWFNLGLKQVSGGEFDKAIASWEKALKINPNLSEAWHNRGSALGRLGEYQQAVDSFEKALAIDPENHQAWNDRAHALYQMQKWSEAADSWSNAVKLAPGNHLFWYNRACALEQLESWAEAISSYEKCLEIKPDFGPARSRYTNLVADSSHAN